MYHQRKLEHNENSHFYGIYIACTATSSPFNVEMLGKHTVMISHHDPLDSMYGHAYYMYSV